MWDCKHNCHDNVEAVLQELFSVDVRVRGCMQAGEVVAPKVA